MRFRHDLVDKAPFWYLPELLIAIVHSGNRNHFLSQLQFSNVTQVRQCYEDGLWWNIIMANLDSFPLWSVSNKVLRDFWFFKMVTHSAYLTFDHPKYKSYWGPKLPPLFVNKSRQGNINNNNLPLRRHRFCQMATFSESEEDITQLCWPRHFNVVEWAKIIMLTAFAFTTYREICKVLLQSFLGNIPNKIISNWNCGDRYRLTVSIILWIKVFHYNIA